MSAVSPRSLRRVEDVAAWLRDRPTLSQVRDLFPAEWQRIESELSRLIAADDGRGVREALTAAAKPLTASAGHARPANQVRSELVGRYLLVEALRQASLRAASGAQGDRLRFGMINGLVLQRLLFDQGLRRKPAAWLPFRLLWPLLTQRRYLMPLVQPKGIYCFYSRRLIRALARTIAGRPCLEIAAGDGTLARFLADEGVQITATDDHSWADLVDCDDVPRLDARTALRRHPAEVVICSWPPAGNDFEQHVFSTPDVQLYIVISTEREHAAGNWQAYRGQRDFDMVMDKKLSRLLLPPDSDAAVYLFHRRAGTDAPASAPDPGRGAST